MKAEKVIGIAACAFACVTGSAFANTMTNWFGAVGSDATIVLTEATTNGVDVSVSGGVITLDGEAELTFTPTETSPARSDNLVTIESSAVLTPSAVSDLPTSGDLGGAQVGFAIAYDGAATNYYCYANGAWGVGAQTPPADANVSFKITLDYRTKKATFEVGGEVVSNDVTFVGSQLSAVAACGSGSLTEVSAKYEIAVAQYGETKYGSIAEATAAAKAASVADPTAAVQVVDANGNTENAGAVADNGLSKIVCEALGLPMDNGSANIAVKPTATDTDEKNITLQLNMPGAPEPGAVGFKISGSDTVYAADAIKIPLAAGTYTITPVLK